MQNSCLLCKTNFATGYESDTLKHYLFDKTATIQIQYCLLETYNNMNLLD